MTTDRRGQAWLPEEEERLRQGYLAGASVTELLTQLGRSRSGIRARPRKLGLDPDAGSSHPTEGAPAPPETLADDDAVLVIDETGFLKQGKASCGVARQYTGSAGKITSCRIGVFACYVSRHGHAFIDRALYLPKAWTDDADRPAAAHVPAGTALPPSRRWPWR